LCTSIIVLYFFTVSSSLARAAPIPFKLTGALATRIFAHGFVWSMAETKGSDHGPCPVQRPKTDGGHMRHACHVTNPHSDASSTAQRPTPLLTASNWHNNTTNERCIYCRT
jgi:hypothetical protein